MTSEGALGQLPATDDEGGLHCYRHPDRSTYVRCGRCDQPICAQCRMQGPVGFRCKECGTLANDPLTTFSPTQAALGTAVAMAGGFVIGLITGGLGWFTIFVAFFAGGVTSEAVIRVTGYKRGVMMLAIVFGGIGAGAIVGGLVSYGVLFGRGADANVVDVVTAALPWLLVSVGSACVGAYTRLR